MHKVLVPKYSGTHRVACLALYRALLRQCGPTTGEASWQRESKPLIRQKFRKLKKLESHSRIVNALKAGYEALDLLSTAHTNQSSAQQITSIVAQAKSHREKYAALQVKSKPIPPIPKPLTRRQAQKAESIRLQEQTTRRHPNAPSVFDRPRPLGGKKRHIPVLVNARGLPFLRYKKPQPRNVGGVLRNKLERRWSWIQRRDCLKIDSLFAADEDHWDKLTDFKTKEQPTWAALTQETLTDFERKIAAFDLNNKLRAEKLWEIVLAEKALAEEEASQK